MNKLILVLTMALALISTHTFAADVAKGKIKSASCASCHGSDGNSTTSAFPNLAGQSESYLLKQLKDFKSGNRVDPVMVGSVAPLTPEDMADLSAYYATQKASMKTSKHIANSNLELGKKIYRGGKRPSGVTACAACHGPTGKGIPSAGFPVLAAQHPAYIVKQLKLFRQHSINAQTGTNEPSRTNDYESMMINFTKSLTNTEIDAVAAYISNL